MQSSALIAGLVGALLSGAFGFIVRRVLDARSQAESERRLAYVLLVRLTGLVAAEAVIRRGISEQLTAAASALVNPESDQYDASHRVSEIISFLLSEVVGKAFRENATARAVPRAVSSMLEEARDSKLAPAQLASLPRQAVAAIDRYQGEQSQMCQVAALWSSYFESGDATWINSETIHSQWRSLNRFLTQARHVQSILVKAGVATEAEVAALQEEQESQLEGALTLGREDKLKIAAARKELPFPKRKDVV